MSGVLSELHVQVREIVGRACEDTIAQHGFVPDPLEDTAEDMEGEDTCTIIYVTIKAMVVCKLGTLLRAQAINKLDSCIWGYWYI